MSVRRKSIFELERRRNLAEDLNKVYSDFENLTIVDSNFNRMTLMDYLDESIKDWPYRQGATDIDGFFLTHGIDEESDDPASVLLILELYINLLYWAPQHEVKAAGLKAFGSETTVSGECNRYLENISFFLEQSNYQIREVETDIDCLQYVISKRDANVDAVLESVPELSENLLSYLDVRYESDEDHKRSVLKAIADYLEPRHKAKIFKGTEYYQLSEDLFTVYNNCNIRHANKWFTKKYRKPKRMKIYDETFKMSIHLLQMDDHYRFKEEMKSLKLAIEEEKAKAKENN